MVVDSARSETGGGWHIVQALVAADGSASHPMLARLSQPRAPIRDLADMIHSLGALHGRQPGVIDHASVRPATAAISAWLTQTGAGFAQAREFLARLTVAAGPLPSTPGQAMSEATIISQRHALDMLAQSDREGCALGAAAALALDWQAIHRLLDATALRFGIGGDAGRVPGAGALPPLGEHSPAFDRALGFGAQQLLAQHRGLWNLLEARISARDAR